ncbi:hypothetical protein T484DRAFT_1798792 [Baffinella frigidus]|nr:hypothetical protein T484DRAFT_1798792 [Cryptophyta sp. CCMP2293]
MSHNMVMAMPPPRGQRSFKPDTRDVGEQLVDENQRMAEEKRRQKMIDKMPDTEDLLHMQNTDLGGKGTLNQIQFEPIMQDKEDLLQHMQNYDLGGKGTLNPQADLNRHILQQKQVVEAQKEQLGVDEPLQRFQTNARAGGRVT